ncbi:MAG: anaerobic C4-dicarboxylate transporter family protein, partial [Thermoanaerobaculia bacterium]|nr:anaerobic C4-dicarboxylate transporter family protein [Thermoanaerobaculia bacterium]
YVTFVAPLVTYVLILASGTTHVIYALLPVIAEVARKADIRPERPLSISVIAGFQGVIASPISAATVALVGFLAAQEVTLPQVLAVTVPSTFLAVVLGALSVAWRGCKLSEDPEYQRRLAAGQVKPLEESAGLEGAALTNARGSTILFFAAILAVVLIGMFPGLRPVYSVAVGEVIERGQVDMGMAIMIVMIAAAGLITLVFRASPEAALKGTIMRSGITAVICIIGVSWLGSSLFEGNRGDIVAAISGLVESYPWSFAAGLFVLSTMLFSAAATVTILVPVGVALGMPAAQLIAFYPAANAVFFLPTYGTVLAGVSFDQTGTTKIGKLLLNHSFMLPGLVTTVSAVVIALLLSAVVLG